MDYGMDTSAKAEEFGKHTKHIHEEVKKHINEMNLQYEVKKNKKKKA